MQIQMTSGKITGICCNQLATIRL